MMSEPDFQVLTSLVMLASAPWAATPGVSVLPSSVMSGPPFPLLSALVQSVVRLVHGIQSTTTLVFLYCGNCWWNCLTMPFIQVTCKEPAPPPAHAVSSARAPRAADEPLLEPQPATPAAAP